MSKFGVFSRLVLMLGLVLPGIALAHWQLDSEHALINFISIKNNQIAEVHQFDNLTGGIDADGKAVVTISLASVNTGIDIRNERMQEHLFATADFPQATISTQLDADWLKGLQQGKAYAKELDFMVDLHGQQQTIKAFVGLIIDTNGNMHVETIKPVIVNASQFGFVEGIVMLQELAGLQAIATAVPVTFAMVFKPA